MDSQITVIIPIYKPDEKFIQLLRMLKKQKNIQFLLYIVDSGSDKKWMAEIEGLDYRYKEITPQQFNHGGTRQAAAETCKGSKILVYLTQDAILADDDTLHNLVQIFKNPQIGCAYGRQLPHKGAGILATHARLFNYPAKSQIKQLSDAKRLGIKTAFISNSFAAYRTKVLQEVGGFPSHVILSEDTYVASKMILAGYKVAYCADAKVYHSHDYTIMQEFRRYFDTGVFHAEEPWIREAFGQAEGEGGRFVRSEFGYVLKHQPSLLLSAFIRDGMKFLGYRIGINEKKIPLWVKRKCSMMKRYWDNSEVK